jgi:transglycosylase-like protein with SLT domain
MIRNEQVDRLGDASDRRPRALHPLEHAETRTIVVRQGSAWQSLAFLCLCLLLLAVVLLGHHVLRGLDGQNEQSLASLARVERRIQQVEAGLDFQSRRRRLVLGMRNHILRVNARVSLGDAYRYAELAVVACEKYPAVDPLLLLAIGAVESGFDPLARSPADARGLYQIWPSTGRLLLRALGWDYDDAALYDPAKNTEAAVLYLDILFATYRDPQMVLAEYNGGPLNAGYFRAGVEKLASETRNYVPRVLEMHARLQEEFANGVEPAGERDAEGSREGKLLAAPRSTATSPSTGPGRSPRSRGDAPPARTLP